MRVSTIWSRTAATVAVASIIGAFATFATGMNAPVSVVRIEGDLSAAERATVQQAVSRAISAGYLSVDLDEVARSVLALSWPREVGVRRVWPDALHIEVRKESVAARWGVDAALSTSGEVIEVPDALGDELPLLDCALADGIEAMRVYQLLREVLESTNLEIVRLQQSELGEWSVQFRDGPFVRLGSEELAPRLARFVTVYRASLAARLPQVAYVDARYGNGVAVSLNADHEIEPSSVSERVASLARR